MKFSYEELIVALDELQNENPKFEHDCEMAIRALQSIKKLLDTDEMEVLDDEIDSYYN